MAVLKNIELRARTNNGVGSLPEGLDENTWKGVMEELERAIPYYERVNHLITLGHSGKMRRVLIEISDLKAGDIVLDAGCGPGNMSELIIEKIRPGGRLICLDPLQSMLNEARRNLSKYPGSEVKLEFKKGRFEDIPLADGCLDALITSYSFRDAVDRESALKEFRRTLKKGGNFLVLDLTKPDVKQLSLIVGFYIKWIVPPLSKIFYPMDKRSPWNALHITYEKMLTSLELVNLIGKYFKIEKVERAMFGTFTAVKAIKT